MGRRVRNPVTEHQAAATALADPPVLSAEDVGAGQFDTAPVSAPVRTVGYQSLRLDQLVPSAGNPASRMDRSDPALVELAESLRVLGQQQPIVVRLISGLDTASYTILAGHRRYAAAGLAGLSVLEARIVECDDQGAAAIRIVENLQRKDLHWTDESAGVAALLACGWSLATISAQLGKAPRWVAVRARLADLHPAWLSMARGERPQPPAVAAYNRVGQWSVPMLEDIGRFPAPTQQEMASDRRLLTCLDARDLRQHLAEHYLLALKAAPWDLDDAELVPAAGACSQCPKRSSCQATLFDTDKKGDRCTDTVCWSGKKTAFVARREAELRADHPRLVKVVTTAHGEPKAKDEVDVCYVDRAKAGTKGAVPALDTETGRLVHVVAKSYASDSTRTTLRSAGKGGDDADADDGGPDKPKVSAADRLGQHLRRRWRHVLSAVIVALGGDADEGEFKSRRDVPAAGKTVRPSREQLVALSAGIGLRDEWHTSPKGMPTAAALGLLPSRQHTDGWRRYRCLAASKSADQDAALWERLRGRLIDQLRESDRYVGSRDQGIDPGLLAQVAAVAGLDLGQLKRDAITALPLPKTLAAIYDESGEKHATGAGKTSTKRKVVKAAKGGGR